MGFARSNCKFRNCPDISGPGGPPEESEFNEPRNYPKRKQPKEHNTELMFLGLTVT